MKKKEYQPKPFIYEIYKNGQLLSVVLTKKDLKKEIQKIKEWGGVLVGVGPTTPTKIEWSKRKRKEEDTFPPT